MIGDSVTEQGSQGGGTETDAANSHTVRQHIHKTETGSTGKWWTITIIII